jgi:4-hydroxybenzoate polyprenyltransferase
MHAFLRLVRWPNLVIAAATQYLLQYLVLVPCLRVTGNSPTLDHFHFFLLVADTALVAATGYIINDLLDFQSDLVNKPDKVFIKRYFSVTQAYFMYWVLLLSGLLLAWHLAQHVGSPSLVLIYPTAAGMLWLYSWFFKKLPLWGNIIVSLFVAFVAGIVLFAERETFAGLVSKGSAEARETAWIFAGYLIFAFFSNLCREIVKDMEDVEGDRLQQAMTLPVRYGMRVAKHWALGCNLILLSLLGILNYLLAAKDLWAAFLFSLVALTLPAGALFTMIYRAREKSQHSRASMLLKYIMLAGLILLLLWRS